MDKIFYNEASSAKMGWEPDWFGADDFDEELIEKITAFQKEHGLTADGLCGPRYYCTLIMAVCIIRKALRKYTKSESQTCSSAIGTFV